MTTSTTKLQGLHKLHNKNLINQLNLLLNQLNLLLNQLNLLLNQLNLLSVY